MRARRATIAAALFAATTPCASCGGEAPDVGLCIRTASDDPDPLDADGATRLVLRATSFEGGHEEIRVFAKDATMLRLPSLAFGRWQFVVQASDAEDEVFATGRTPFVDVDDEHAQIPCIYVATVGTFGQTTNEPPEVDPRLVFGLRESTTAFIATDEGLVRYDHTTGAFSAPIPLLDERGEPYSLAGAVWADLGAGEAAAILPNGPGLVVDASGGVKSAVPIDDALGGLDGATAVGVGVASVLLIGGATDPASTPASAGSVRIVDLAVGTVTPAPYELAVRDARVSARLPNGAFVVVGNNEGSAESPIASSLVAIVDPASPPSPGSTALLAHPRVDPILAVSGTNVLVLGGRETDALSAKVEQLRVNGGHQLLYYPYPDVLNVARAGGVALATFDGVVVAGGETDAESTEATAERVRFDSAPSLCPDECDAPGVPLPSPVAGQLHDGSILVVGNGTAVVYRP